MWRKINQESEKLYLNCINKNLTITTAESCTGGNDIICNCSY